VPVADTASPELSWETPGIVIDRPFVTTFCLVKSSTCDTGLVLDAKVDPIVGVPYMLIGRTDVGMSISSEDTLEGV
jgi:hypothetical protein